MCHNWNQLKCVRLYATGIFLVILASLQVQQVHSEAQFFDFFSSGNSGNQNQNDRLFFGGGGGGGGGSYGAPQQSGYGVPKAPVINNRPSYGGQVNNRPSYGGGGGGRPSYGGGAKPSYGGGGKGFDIPKLNIPNPIDFKAGVLRSKGRIASGLLHAKAGILRAGANILAQKANALDKVAQAIPGAKAQIINQLQGLNKDKGGGGYGAPQQTGYGVPTPPPPSYNTPNAGYGTPRPGFNGGLSTPRPNYGGGTIAPRPVGPNLVSPQPVNNNFVNSQQTLSQTFPASNNYNAGNNFQNQGVSTSNVNNNQLFNNNNNFVSSPSLNTGIGNNNFGTTNVNGVGTLLTVNQNQQQNQQDSYGSPQGNVITGTNIGGTSNINNFARGTVNNVGNVNNVDPGLTTNTVSSSLTLASPVQSFNNGINNNNLNTFNNGNNFNQQTSNNNPFLSNNNNNISPINNNFISGNSVNENLLLQESIRQQQSANLNSIGNVRFQNQQQCPAASVLQNLLGDIFMGHEVIPDILDEPPKYPLDLTYKTIRTYPGMKLTADMTRFKPMIDWPAEQNSLYTVVMSNLDINNRRNRTLSEFWHWFVANIPGDNLDEGEVIFELLFPLVLPEGDGDHRFGYFVFKQPQRLDYADEGGPTDACSPNMSNGRGPFKSTKNFQKKYNLELTAATFLIIDYNEESMDIACEWQKCIGDTINLVSPLRCAK